jgi:hypothetical protein
MPAVDDDRAWDIGYADDAAVPHATHVFGARDDVARASVGNFTELVDELPELGSMQDRKFLYFYCTDNMLAVYRDCARMGVGIDATYKYVV